MTDWFEHLRKILKPYHPETWLMEPQWGLSHILFKHRASYAESIGVEIRDITSREKTEELELRIHFLRQTIPSIIGNVGLLIISLIALPIDRIHPLLMIWSGIIICTLIVRYYAYQYSEELLTSQHFHRIPELAAVVTAALWGIFPWFIHWSPADDATAFIPYLLAGISAASVVTTAASRLVGNFFPILVLGLGIFPLSLIHSEAGASIPLLILTFIAFLLKVSRDFRLLLTKNFKEICRTATLTEELAQQNLALSKASDQAKAASAVKSEFLARMSHEIRTPLNAVLGMAALAMECSTESTVKEYLRYVEDSANHLLGIVSDVLDLAKIDAGGCSINNQDFLLHNELHSVEGLFISAAQVKGIAFTVQISADVPRWIHSDSLRLRQILINFVGNALKFTPTGGSITLASSIVDSNLRLEVTDTGPGIPKEAHQKIFEAFHQLPDSEFKGEGTGLGLTISAKLSKLLGGAIDVTSTPNSGSTFSLILPLQHIAPREIHLEKQSRTDATCGNDHDQVGSLKILVAEDNQMNQKLIQLILERSGHTVSLASNGREVLTAYKNKTFDLILMDCSMPELDGLETTRILRNTGATLPIIALTAHALPSIREECFAAGMNNFLTKPIEREKLDSLLESITGTKAPR